MTRAKDAAVGVTDFAEYSIMMSERDHDVM